jgi:hypothetical protein
MRYKSIWILSGLMFVSAGYAEYYINGIVPVVFSEPREPDYDPHTLMMSDQFDSTGMARGLVPENEISGIELSNIFENKLWAINDSGNGPNLYLLDSETAGILCTYHLPNLTNIDWEDISLGKGFFGNSTLYIGDFGNNFLNRSKLRIYLLAEPDYQSDSEQIVSLKPDHLELDFVYPDGPHNAEAFFVDDKTQDIYIITKENKRSGVYLFPYPHDPDKTGTLIYLGSLPFPLVVAADYNTETQLLMIKTYDRIFMWENKENKKLSELIFETPIYAPYHPVEMQGESLSIGPSGYYTLSEKNFGIEPILYFYGKRE